MQIHPPLDIVVVFLTETWAVDFSLLLVKGRQLFSSFTTSGIYVPVVIATGWSQASIGGIIKSQNEQLGIDFVSYWLGELTVFGLQC